MTQVTGDLIEFNAIPSAVDLLIPVGNCILKEELVSQVNPFSIRAFSSSGARKVSLGHSAPSPTWW